MNPAGRSRFQARSPDMSGYVHGSQCEKLSIIDLRNASLVRFSGYVRNGGLRRVRSPTSFFDIAKTLHIAKIFHISCRCGLSGTFPAKVNTL